MMLQYWFSVLTNWHTINLHLRYLWNQVLQYSLFSCKITYEQCYRSKNKLSILEKMVFFFIWMLNFYMIIFAHLRMFTQLFQSFTQLFYKCFFFFFTILLLSVNFFLLLHVLMQCNYPTSRSIDCTHLMTLLFVQTNGSLSDSSLLDRRSSSTWYIGHL